MELLTGLTLFIVLLMIKIGDFILSIFRYIKEYSLISKNFILKKTKSLKSLSPATNAPSTSQSFPLNKNTHVKNTAVNFKINYSNPFVIIRKKLSIKKRKSRKHSRVKKVTFNPLSFFVKIKYFIAGGLFTLIVVGIPLILYVFVQSLPNPNQLTSDQIPLTTKIYDRNHTLLYQIYANQNRTDVQLSDIPTTLKEATISIEDKDFYNHPGFDITAIIRSMIADVSGRSEEH